MAIWIDQIPSGILIEVRPRPTEITTNAVADAHDVADHDWPMGFTCAVEAGFLGHDPKAIIETTSLGPFTGK
jgi:hypothetical protein